MSFVLSFFLSFWFYLSFCLSCFCRFLLSLNFCASTFAIFDQICQNSTKNDKKMTTSRENVVFSGIPICHYCCHFLLFLKNIVVFLSFLKKFVILLSFSCHFSSLFEKSSKNNKKTTTFVKNDKKMTTKMTNGDSRKKHHFLERLSFFVIFLSFLVEF